MYEIMKIFFINDLKTFEGVQILPVQKRNIFLAKRVSIYKFMQKLLCQHVSDMYSAWYTVSCFSLRFSSHTGTLVSYIIIRPIMAPTYFDDLWLGMNACKEWLLCGEDRTNAKCKVCPIPQNKIELSNMGERHRRI